MSPWGQRVGGFGLKVICLDITLAVGRLVMAYSECLFDKIWNDLGDRSVSMSIKDFLH